MKNKEIRESYSTIPFPSFKLPCTTAFKLEIRLMDLGNLVVRKAVLAGSKEALAIQIQCIYNNYNIKINRI